MSAPTPEEIARWRQWHFPHETCPAPRLCDEVERLRAENERLLYTSDKQTVAWKDRALKAEAALVSPPPRTEEEPPPIVVGPGCPSWCSGHVTGGHPAPAPSQPQKATHPFTPPTSNRNDHDPATNPRTPCYHVSDGMLCGLPASDPIHAPAAHTEQP